MQESRKSCKNVVNTESIVIRGTRLAALKTSVGFENVEIFWTPFKACAVGGV